VQPLEENYNSLWQYYVTSPFHRYHQSFHLTVDIVSMGSTRIFPGGAIKKLVYELMFKPFKFVFSHP
jgi:hypothetical protein